MALPLIHLSKIVSWKQYISSNHSKCGKLCSVHCPTRRSTMCQSETNERSFMASFSFPAISFAKKLLVYVSVARGRPKKCRPSVTATGSGNVTSVGGVPATEHRSKAWWISLTTVVSYCCLILGKSALMSLSGGYPLNTI